MRTLQIVTDPTKIDREKWAEFVKFHSDGCLFQTPHMFDVFCGIRNHEPRIFACFDISQNELVGILVAVILKEYDGCLGRLSARSVIWGGPIVKGNDVNIAGFMLEYYNRQIRKNVVYSQIRNIFPAFEIRNVLESNGYKREERLNIIVDLRPDKDELWKNLNTKRRNEIRRAEKEGTTVREIDNLKLLEESYKILVDIYKRARLPLPDLQLFIKAFEKLREQKMFRIFGAFWENKLIGTMYLLTYKNRVYDWYAGSYSEYYSKYPNDLLPWEVFVTLKDEGYTIFDFGGAGKADIPYSVRDYKKKFGGATIKLCRMEKIHQPFCFKIAKIGFHFWQFVKT